jgi:hypothetical protein
MPQVDRILGIYRCRKAGKGGNILDSNNAGIRKVATSEWE